MKYNYILIHFGDGIYKYYYKDVNQLTYAYFDYGYPYNKQLQILMKLHLSQKINRRLDLPNKEFWIKLHIKKLSKKYDNMKQKYSGLCFILFSDCLSMEKYGLNKWIRYYFPEAKIIYYFQDIIEKDLLKLDLVNGKRNMVDLIMTYDKKDAEMYGLYYHNAPYSKLSKLKYKNDTIKYDVVFVGLIKDRFKEIKNAFDILSQKGLKCFFYLVDNHKDKKSNTSHNPDFIITDKNISYYEYLNLINQSKCILEIIQKGSSGNTSRVNEAIEFDKYLLTNNRELLSNQLYDSKYMFVYKSLDSFDPDRINGKVSYPNKELLSPHSFLQDIEEELNKLYDEKTNK